MIRKIHIKNFRSIREENLRLGKITVLTGANNSGKSSIIYGLMVLQDFVFNPNQTLEELFALPFINLGGFEEVKSKNTTAEAPSGFIRLGVTVNANQYGTGQTLYKLSLGKGRTFIDLISKKGKFEINSSLEIGLPYAANKEERYEVKIIGTNNIIPFKWNGFQAKVEIPSDSPISEHANAELLQTINGPTEELNKADFVPIT